MSSIFSGIEIKRYAVGLNLRLRLDLYVLYSADLTFA